MVKGSFRLEAEWRKMQSPYLYDITGLLADRSQTVERIVLVSEYV